MKCRHCGSTGFRPSRLRKTDIFRLLILRYPIRCRDCQQRKFVSFPVALKVRHDNKLRHEEERRRKDNDRSSNARPA
jgi:hypothetical protein